MINLTKLAAGLLGLAILTGCGGGSSGANDDTPAFGSNDAKIEFFPQKPSLLSNRSGFPFDPNSPYYTQMGIRITDDNGFIAPGLTIVDLATSDVNIAGVTGGSGRVFTSSCAGTASGVAAYFIGSGPNAGTATLSASVTTPLVSGSIDEDTGICTTTIPAGARTVAKQLQYRVDVGPEPFRRLVIAPQRTTLAANTLGAAPAVNSPFVIPVEVTQRTFFGALVDGGNITVSVQRSDLLQLSFDNPTTPANEFATLASSIAVPVIAGKALFYVHSRDRDGTAAVTVQASEGGGNFSELLNITVGGGTSNATNQLAINRDLRPVYVSGSNGNQVAPVQVSGTRGLGEPTVDPATGVNNILLEIVNGSGESISGASASGANVSGTSIRIRTVQGIASAIFQSGTRQGAIVLRATTDAADNNVDNGVTSAVLAQSSVVVSDGKLFDLKLTGATGAPAATGGGATAAPTGPISDETVTFAGDPTAILAGVYSRLVTVVGTDRQGNPVIPNTTIEFGLIDAPVSGFPTRGPGIFDIAGSDGDPAEGGFNFSSASGTFTTSGGGAGPGDTLILFGENNAPIRDLESARIVARVNGPTNLDVRNTTRFNLNDDTGSSINRGPVVPYVVGRATIGTVGISAQTDARGIAATRMIYPVSQLGHGYVLWARGAGDTPAGQSLPELVTDADPGVFEAKGPVTITASPATIRAAVAQTVQVCIRDANAAPIQGVLFNYSFTGGGGSVDGATTGVTLNASDRSGCARVVVRSSAESVRFSAGGASAVVTITGGGGAQAVLFAFPDSLGGSGGDITLRLLDSEGNPISGVQIAGSCTGGQVSLSIPPGVTNANGETTASIRANLDSTTSPGSGSCPFTALGATATVRLLGINLCNLGISPPPPGCTTTPVVTTPRTLTVRLLDPTGTPVAAGFPLVSVVGNAGGINCTPASQAANSGCLGTAITDGSTVTLVAATGLNGVPGAESFCRWTGADNCFGTQPTVQVLMNSNKTCNAIFSASGPAGCPTQ
jgi:hypothetical protein